MTRTGWQGPRSGLPARRERVRGRVIAHRDGYGFLVRDDPGNPGKREGDVFLPAREMLGLLHGDRIVCDVRETGRRGPMPARRVGAVVEIVERNTRRIVGRFFRARGGARVVPEHRNLSQDVLIPDGGGTEGEVVVAEIVEQPTPERPPVGRIVERLGEPGRPGMAAEIALHAYDIPREWPDEVLAETERVPLDVGATPGRDDLRALPLVTIDGPDAKDFDDAVHCAPRPSGWKLTIAIADVSHYVAPGSAIDREAARRGTSVYLPGRVVPMLPERLSNGICSLNPEVDRLCLACEMHVDRSGRVTRTRFRDAIMRSRARLTYEEVEAAAFDRDAGTRRRLGSLIPHLEALREVYTALRGARRRRGAIDLELPEPRIVFDRDGAVAHVEPAPRYAAHRLIEECMVAANVAAARRLTRLRAPLLYRVHPPPDPVRVEEMTSFFGRLGLEPDFGAELRPSDFAALAERAAARRGAEVLHLLLLRAMEQAVYRPDNDGHFGLALTHYTHFTSPIRRYPDLLAHRALRGSLEASHDEMEALGISASAAERRADDAARDAVSRLVCEYLENRVGEVFAGRIAAVASFGLFVRLEGLGVDGLVHVSALGRDWYRHDRTGHCLEGERGGRRFRLGDELEVRLARVDPTERRIHLEPLVRDDPPGTGRREPRRGRRVPRPRRARG